MLTNDIEATFGRQLRAPLRHQAGGMRPRPQCERGHLFGRRPLEIERLGDLGFEARDVVVANVAAIFAQMRGDAVGAGGDRDPGCRQRIGMNPATGVAERGHMIDIDAQPEMRDRRQSC